MFQLLYVQPYFVLAVTFQRLEKFVFFLGHRATMGCSKCLLPFPTIRFGEKTDYSNFKRSDWTNRTNNHHRSEAMKSLSCVTRSARAELQKKSGIRYSCLLELPYFNAPRMCVIDPSIICS